MIRQSNIFAISFVVCISSILIADAFVLGGYLSVPEDRFHLLKNHLKSSTNLDMALGGTRVQILDILSAKLQLDAAATNYRILATIRINGRTENCCFELHRSYNQDYIVLDAKVGAQKC